MAKKLWALVVVLLGVSVMYTDIMTTLLFKSEMIEQKRVVVCGASTGIGEEIAYTYAKHHAKIALVARRKDALERVADKCRELGAASVTLVAADLGTEAGVESAITTSLSQLGGIDILVLNHIIGFFGSWMEESKRLPMDEVARLFAVNTFSYINAATLALPHLEKTGGSIIVVSSAAGKQGMPLVAPYSATKHALHGFFNSLRHDLRAVHSNVTITLTVLGSIDTAHARDNTRGVLDHIPWYPPHEAAASIVKSGAIGLTEAYYPSHLWALTLINALSPALGDLIVGSVIN